MAALEAIDGLPAERPRGPFGSFITSNAAASTHFPAGDVTAVTPYTDIGRGRDLPLARSR